MPEPNSFYTARLTPPGSGAIATVRAEGPGAVEAVATHVRVRAGRPLRQCPLHRPLLGLFGDEPGEPIVVCRHGRDAVEIHCHGGPAAAERIEAVLAQAGGHRCDWPEWVRRQPADSITADAHLALAHARTERTAAILLDQFGGALRRALVEVENLIVAGKYRAAREKAADLLARAEVGRHLTRPWRVVLTGRPNVGKSCLMNAMLGYERVIVDPTAGTTRDVLTATTAIDGWPVELTDTAGLAPNAAAGTDEPVLLRGALLAREQIAAADLIVLVFDRTRPLSAEERQWLRDVPQALHVDNKSDLAVAPGARPPAMATSALRGEGIANLLRGIAERLVPDPPPPGAAVPFTEAQCLYLRELSARCLPA